MARAAEPTFLYVGRLKRYKAVETALRAVASLRRAELPAAALQLAASWIGDIAPRGVLNYDEEESRGVFQSGNAVFMRNWPYAWALGNAADSPIRGRIGVIAVPQGGSGAGTDGHQTGVLGGWQLAVSRYSQHPELAADPVLEETGPEPLGLVRGRVGLGKGIERSPEQLRQRLVSGRRVVGQPGRIRRDAPALAPDRVQRGDLVDVAAGQVGDRGHRVLHGVRSVLARAYPRRWGRGAPPGPPSSPGRRAGGQPGAPPAPTATSESSAAR